MPTPLTSPPTRMLTSEQAAKYLGTNTHTLSSWRYKGEGPTYVRMGGGMRGIVRYPLDALEDWIKAHTITPGARR